MKSVRKGLLVVMATAAVTVCFVPSMAGAEGIDIGGKTAMSGSFSVTSIQPADFFGVDIEATIVYAGASLTRTSASGRWEYGA
ncbi:MAG: hypothetical protein JRE71_20080, partial [Deltaproteobacteria bacterium]|nr:hypothetical protein [Deltaproteobacteria bacterium]